MRNIPPDFEHYFQRIDESNDALFYESPRFVVHIDEQAIALVSQIFYENIPDESIVLDLMSSWRTHWPRNKNKQKIIGIGLNPEEMSENPDLDEFIVQDLNTKPTLGFENTMFDAVIITVSVQYLINPFAVFKEVQRILKPGGVFIVTFSNRMFSTKAVKIWKETNEVSRMELVKYYMELIGGFESIETEHVNADSSQYSDPLYAVKSYKIK